MRKPVVQRELFYNELDNVSNMVTLTLLPKDLALYWQRCGITADFGASFASFCFHNIDNVKNTLSAILNELVENAVKYSLQKSKRVKITLFDHDNALFFEVENSISKNQWEVFNNEVDYLQCINDIEDEYIKAMERSMTGEESKLGLLTMLNDYKVELAICFNSDKLNNRDVKIQVKINPEDLLC